MPQRGPTQTLPAGVPAAPMPGSQEDCHRRFQAAVDVIQNLPKNGCYRPSYDVMLRLYSLYKQATCGPCSLSRPGFWDPVGRYKWDAWQRLGTMSSEAAMVAYVDEIKRVAREVIDSMPMTDKMASFFHYFEPLYLVIHDMPQPPEALLRLRKGPELDRILRVKLSEELQSLGNGELLAGQGPVGRTDLLERGCGEADCRVSLRAAESLSEGPVVSSDSESEVFCDSLEQLDHDKGLHSLWSPDKNHTPVTEATQMGMGRGGEGVDQGKGQPMRRRGSPRGVNQRRREDTGSRDQAASHPTERGLAGGRGEGGAGGQGGGKRGPERKQAGEVQEQIALALQRLREDMHGVLERLETLERLVATLDQESCRRSSGPHTTPARKGTGWCGLGVSGRTLLFLLLWPLLAQGLLVLVRRRHRRI
ncbi:ACBD4 protein, partial [Amia calva]|nr:ACBD4 protein [Amia calva]